MQPDLQAASLAGADGQETGRVEVRARFSLGGPTQEIWVGWLISERTGDSRGRGLWQDRPRAGCSVSPGPWMCRRWSRHARLEARLR